MARTKTETTGGGHLMSYAEVAIALGVSASTVSRLVTSGRLPSIRAGARSVKVPAHELERIVRQGGILSEERTG